MATGWERVEGAPGIYRRGDRYVVTYRDAGGRQRRVSAATLREARRLKADSTTRAARGEPEADRRITYAEYAAGVLAFHAPSVRPHVAREYDRVNRLWLLPRFASRRIAEIGPADVRALVADVYGAGLTANTARNYLKPLRVVMNQAVADGLIVRNPFQGVRISAPRRLEVDEDDDDQRAKALTRDELTALLAIVQPRWRPFFTLLATTGLRVSEAIGLRWTDLDLEGRTCLRVRQGIVKGHVDRPKTRQSRRTVPFGAETARLLREHRAREREAGRGGSRDLAFPNDVGNPLNPENVRHRVLKPAAEEAGCGWAGFHAFRHTCASLLIDEGRSIVQVSRWLGHATPVFTLSTYAHWLDGDDLGEPLELPQTTKDECRQIAAVSEGASAGPSIR